MFIPVISLWQPWAQWVLLGWKTIETRTHRRFESLAGKRIGIHIAQKWDPEWKNLAGFYLSPNQISATERFNRDGGLIGGTAFVKSHRYMLGSDSSDALIRCDRDDRWGLDLTDIVKFQEPILCKGKQGIWYFDLPTEQP